MSSDQKKPRIDPDALARFANALANEKQVQSEVEEVEWNFSKCPKAQLLYCQMYEYGRSSPLILRQVARWRKAKFVRADQPLKSNRELETVRQMDFFRLFPEFPETPWLALDAEQVKSRLRSLPKRRPILVRAVPVEALNVEGMYEDSVSVLEPSQTATVQPVEINWFYHDKELIAAFKRLLAELRPYRAPEKRGRTEPRVLLNALAAKRLLAQHTVVECDNITQSALGKSLFRGDSNWYDARQKAEDHLAGRLPPIPVEQLIKKLPVDEFSDDQENALWQHWVGLKASESRALLRLSTDKFAAKMRDILEKSALP